MFVEVALRLAYAYPPFLDRTLADESTSWQRIWIFSQKYDDADGIAVIESYDPAVGWIPVANLEEVIADKGFRVTTNAPGFRSLVNVRESKSLPRIILLGDSYTFGDEADDDEIFSYFLQEALPDTEVINMGVRGFGQDQMLIHF